MGLRPGHSQVPAALYAVCRAESARRSAHAHTLQSFPEIAPAVDPPVFSQTATSGKPVTLRSGRILPPATLGRRTCGSDGLVHTRARPRSDPERPDPASIPILAGSNWHRCSRCLQTPIPPAPDTRDFLRTPLGPLSDWRSSDSPSADLTTRVHK